MSTPQTRRLPYVPTPLVGIYGIHGVSGIAAQVRRDVLAKRLGLK